MSNNNKSRSNGGLGFFGTLTIVFIALKLMGYITWSWWLVFLPIWGTAILEGIIAVIAAYYEVKAERRRQEEEAERRRTSGTRFMRRLQEAMDESERKRTSNLN